MTVSAPEILSTPEETVEPSTDPAALSSAEIAECTCPEWCERDHDQD
jgi:hypothetical protein